MCLILSVQFEKKIVFWVFGGGVFPDIYYKKFKAQIPGFSALLVPIIVLVFSYFLHFRRAQDLAGADPGGRRGGGGRSLKIYKIDEITGEREMFGGGQILVNGRN